jgi:hypothetical protein
MPRRCVTGGFGVLVVLAAAACERRSLAPNDAGGPGQIGVDAAAPDLPIHVVSDAREVDVRLDVIAADTPTDVPQNGLYCGGGVTCYGTDLCVIVKSCGGPVNCEDTIDAGQCPPGSTLNADCPTGRPGCVPDCTPPPPTCAPKPASCTVGVNCGCLPVGLCPGTCWQAEGRVVFCANQ